VVSALGSALAALLLLASCPASVDPATDKGDAAAAPRKRAGRPGPSNASCDPASCEAMCSKTACGTEANGCLAHCQEVCGDGYFDDRDGPVIACVLIDERDPCAALRACCEPDYTSQLCGRDQ
jgi:hypothetical protein